MGPPHCSSRVRVFGLALVAVSAACVPAVRSSPFSDGDPHPDRIAVVVENNVFDDVTVYVKSVQGRFRLGRVGGCTKGSFAPPPEVVGSARVYRLVAVYSGRRRTVETSPIEVVPGGTTIWTLGASASLSAVVIR